MVRPHLEYGSAIWGPYYQADIKTVEAVQHRVTKLIPTLRIEDRLKSLKLPSLVYRRRRGDMSNNISSIFTCNIQIVFLSGLVFYRNTFKEHVSFFTLLLEIFRNPRFEFEFIFHFGNFFH